MDRGLAAAVGGLAAQALAALDRAHVDDLAVLALDHVWDHVLAAQEGADDVDGEELLPLLPRHLPERFDRLHVAGVVDQDVDLPVRLHGLGDHGLHLLFVRYVDLDRERLSPAFFDLLGDRVDGSGHVVDLVHGSRCENDLGSGVGHAEGDALSDSPACSGDDCDLVFELHAVLHLDPRALEPREDRLQSISGNCFGWVALRGFFEGSTASASSPSTSFIAWSVRIKIGIARLPVGYASRGLRRNSTLGWPAGQINRAARSRCAALAC